MGLSPAEEKDPKLLRAAYDRLLIKYKKRKIGYLEMKRFLLDLIKRDPMLLYVIKPFLEKLGNELE